MTYNMHRWDNHIEAFRKRLNRAGYYKIHIVRLKDSVFLTCFDLYGDFHHVEIPYPDLSLYPKSTITLDLE